MSEPCATDDAHTDRHDHDTTQTQTDLRTPQRTYTYVCVLCFIFSRHFAAFAPVSPKNSYNEDNINHARGWPVKSLHNLMDDLIGFDSNANADGDDGDDDHFIGLLCAGDRESE